MKKLFMAVIALMMTLSASAQFYIYFSDGTVARALSVLYQWRGGRKFRVGLSVLPAENQGGNPL